MATVPLFIAELTDVESGDLLCEILCPGANQRERNAWCESVISTARAAEPLVGLVKLSINYDRSPIWGTGLPVNEAAMYVRIEASANNRERAPGL